MSDLLTAAATAFERRRPAGLALADDAADVAMACRAIAKRFAAGGTLLTFGSGGPAADAAHVAVEFLHPVIVGKRALPALSLSADPVGLSGAASAVDPTEVFADSLRLMSRPGDIVLGLADDGNAPAVRRAFAAAADAGLLTIALTNGRSDALAADGTVAHLLVAHTDDARVAKEVHVTTYHVLWELVHVFLDRGARGVSSSTSDLDALYPFLAAPATAGNRADLPDADLLEADLLEEVRRSTAEKAAEIVALRDQLATELALELVACAEAMAARFTAGARLYCFGNGGSTDAQAVAALFCAPGVGWRPLPAIALPNDVAVLTALANDVSFEVVFARQLAAFARPGDIAFGLSTSGGSANVLRAFDEASRRGLLTVGLAGYDGGKLRTAGLDHLFVVPSPSVHRIQEAQTTVYDVLWELVQVALAG